MNRLSVELDLRVLPANFEIVLRETGLLNELLIRKVGGAHLRRIGIFANRVSDTPPDIRLPRHIERETELVAIEVHALKRFSRPGIIRRAPCSGVRGSGG